MCLTVDSLISSLRNEIYNCRCYLNNHKFFQFGHSRKKCINLIEEIDKLMEEEFNIELNHEEYDEL